MVPHRLAVLVVLACGLGACQHQAAGTATLTPATAGPAPKPAQVGTASWYGGSFKGRRTASGERFNPGALTAAHPHLPIGTVLRVTNLDNQRSVAVRVNDRGPFTGRRIIDLSRASADRLDMVRAGHARVAVEVVTTGTAVASIDGLIALTQPPAASPARAGESRSAWTRLPNLAQRTRVADALAFTGPDADFLP